ncbi:uncharacterized protein METZ01_LOCUS407464 [marine metagenome]|uniref:Uncharacterized protein n=1 Tax=marine metagenome TaxID=408172 RepID=A0A382W7X3_9ZZZZ
MFKSKLNSQIIKSDIYYEDIFCKLDHNS